MKAVIKQMEQKKTAGKLGLFFYSVCVSTAFNSFEFFFFFF